jgi:hypothetical protein
MASSIPGEFPRPHITGMLLIFQIPQATWLLYWVPASLIRTPFRVSIRDVERRPHEWPNTTLNSRWYSWANVSLLLATGATEIVL